MVYQFHNVYIPVSFGWSAQPRTSLTEILQLLPMLMLLIGEAVAVADCLAVTVIPVINMVDDIDISIMDAFQVYSDPIRNLRSSVYLWMSFRRSFIL